MATSPDLIEDAVVTWLRQIAKLEDSLDHEPAQLPRALPVTTLLLIQTDPRQAETGLGPGIGVGEDVTYVWRLSIYVRLDDYKKAQQDLKDLTPAVLAKIRAHPTADAVAGCDKLWLEDPGEEPIFSPDDGYVRKSLRLSAVLTER